MKIGVIGCGLAGMAAAAFLSRSGHDVDILERAPEPRPIGAGLLLQPPGIEILRELGAHARLTATAGRITRLDSRTSAGVRLIDLDYTALHPDGHGLGLIRPSIWSALLASALSAGARVRADHTVDAVNSEDGRATVHVNGRGALHYDLAIVAAGTHSVLGPNGLRRVSRLYPWGCLWMTVELPRGWPLHVLQQRCVGTRVMVGILPTGTVNGRNVAALYWSVRNDLIDSWSERPLSAWRCEVAAAWPEAGDLVAPLAREDIQHAIYRDVWADPPYRRNIIAIGDAAHGTSPQLGQGATLALRDAAALAECLLPERALEISLQHYWRRRRRQTAYYRLASRALTPVFQSDSAFLGMLRDGLARSVNWLPFVRRQALMTLIGAKTGIWTYDGEALRRENCDQTALR
jgi:2-polyprenyl-6-methoxyphenol hydroxylase-like FAD-dependent oxidoreductase